MYKSQIRLAILCVHQDSGEIANNKLTFSLKKGRFTNLFLYLNNRLVHSSLWAAASTTEVFMVRDFSIKFRGAYRIAADCFERRSVDSVYCNTTFVVAEAKIHSMALRYSSKQNL